MNLLKRLDGGTVKYINGVNYSYPISFSVSSNYFELPNQSLININGVTLESNKEDLLYGKFKGGFYFE